MSAKTGAQINAMASKRIRKEIADLAKENLGNIVLEPSESNIFRWKAKLPGPAESPYEGGVFDVDIEVPGDYPFSPPVLYFRTKVYHCNIAPSGAICLDLLKKNWSPALSLYKVILSLSSLLTDPNPSDPLVPNIAQEYKRDKAKHDRTAREWVKLYATPKNAPPPAPAVTAPKATTSRPKAVSRNNTASSSNSQPPPPVAGTRRPHAATNGNGNGAGSSGRPISLDDSDDDADVEVLVENGRDNAGGTASRSSRPSKRSRPNGNTRPNGHDDVIVIDD